MVSDSNAKRLSCALHDLAFRAIHCVPWRGRNTETPDPIDIDGKNTITSFEADARKMSNQSLGKRIIDGRIDMGTKGRKKRKQTQEASIRQQNTEGRTEEEINVFTVGFR